VFGRVARASLPSNPMKTRFRIGAIALAGALGVGLLAGCGSSGNKASASATTDAKVDYVDETGKPAVTIRASNNFFTPQFVKVSPGTTVTFDNVGTNDHNVIAVKDGSFKNIEADNFTQGDKVTVKLDNPGDYSYYCSLHGTPTSAMYGKIQVVS
jgi:plastocyanin